MEIKLLQIREAQGEIVNSPETILALMTEEGKADREAMWVLHLNTKKQVIEKELVALGILNAATIHPREVFRKAVINSSDSIITVHNHPSSEATPSANDLEIWEQLIAAGKILGINVIDHLIITPNGRHYSYARGK